MAIKVADTLERLDNTLDEVDSLLLDLPLTKEIKVKLTSMVYELWMEVEDDLAKQGLTFGSIEVILYTVKQ